MPVRVDALRKCLSALTRQAAQRFINLANEALLGALRLAAAGHDRDAAQLPLIVSGGLGPLHANAVARLAGSSSLIVPPLAGALSTVGLLCAPRRRAFTRALSGPLAPSEHARIGVARTALRTWAESWLQQQQSTGSGVRRSEQIELRYRGEQDILSLGLDSSDASDVNVDVNVNDLGERFAAEHEHRFGYRLATPIDMVRLRTQVEIASEDDGASGHGGLAAAAAQLYADDPAGI